MGGAGFGGAGADGPDPRGERAGLELGMRCLAEGRPCRASQPTWAGGTFIAPSHPRGGNQAVMPTPRGRRLPLSHQGEGG
jgi:hypothetical protein